MASEPATQAESWKLPLSIVGPVDVGRIIRELDQVDNFMMQASIRTPDSTVKMTKTSRLMDELVVLNGLNLLLEPDRKKLRDFAEELRDHAPVLHMSFSADPSPLFMQKMMGWVRTEIGPTTLVRVGLQPSIGAGCILRTANRYFDMSLRERFEQNKHMLVQKLSEIKVDEVPAT